MQILTFEKLRFTSLPFGLGRAVSVLACRRRVAGTISGGRCRKSLRYVIPGQANLTISIKQMKGIENQKATKLVTGFNLKKN